MMDIHNITYTDKWNLYSVEVVENLQQRFQQHEWWLVNASVFGDNRQAFLFFFPLLAGILNVVGAKALWAAIFVEWSNLILKWVFPGDRPYWWTNITPLYTAESRPKLNQFFNTCESGPGTPSGHVMMNVAVIYIFAQGMKNALSKSNSYKIIAKPLSMLVTATCLMWIVIIFMSRLYIQAHFLHQCIFGVIIGYIIGRFIWSNNWLLKSQMNNLILVTVAMLGTCFWLVTLFEQNGVDPLWTIPLAKKHCITPTNITFDTHPWFLMIRFTAASLGLGIALSSDYRKYFINNKRTSFTKTIFNAGLNIAVGRVMMALQGMLPTDQFELYLTVSFFIFFLLPLLVINIIPYQLSKIFN